MRAPAGKVWVCETRLQGFPWRDLRKEILYPPWIAATDEWLRTKVDMPHLEGKTRHRGDDRLPFWGVRAPTTEWLEVKGAWMQDGVPLPATKHRADQIRARGWT